MKKNTKRRFLKKSYKDKKNNFKKLFNQLKSEQSLNMTTAKKRSYIEQLIRFAQDSDEVWKVIEVAEKMPYSLTDRQNSSIISKLVQFSSDSEMEKVENYAKMNRLRLHYIVESTEKEIEKILT